MLGHVLVDTKQFAAAVAELKTAVSLDPENETSLYQLARAYRALGRASDAQRAFEQFRRVKARAKSQEGELVQLLKTVQPEH